MKKMSLKERLKKSFKALSDTVKRFPYATVHIILAAVIMIFYNHAIEYDTMDDALFLSLERIAMSLLLCVPLALSIKMLLELLDKKHGLLSVSLRVCAMVFFVLYSVYGFPKITDDMSNNFTFVSMVRYFCITIFFWGAFFAIPFILGREKIEVFSSNVLWRLVVAGFYYGISFAAVMGIFELIEVLFDVDIFIGYYKDIPYVLGAIFVIAFFFTGIPKINDEFSNTHSKFFRIFLLHVLMPILIAYTVVIYAYFFYMIMQSKLPSNIIGNLVLWYSFVSIFVLYFSKVEIEKSKWAKLFDTWFPRFLFLPLGMMFYALYLRVSQYGITEPRYYMLVGGGWALGMTAYIVFINYKKRKNVIIPLTISLVALITVIEPISSFSISKTSQINRLDKIFAENEIIEEGDLKNVSDIDVEIKHEISSIIQYFDNRHSIQDIPVLSDMDSFDDVEESLGFELNEWKYSEEKILQIMNFVSMKMIINLY